MCAIKKKQLKISTIKWLPFQPTKCPTVCREWFWQARVPQVKYRKLVSSSSLIDRVNSDIYNV